MAWGAAILTLNFFCHILAIYTDYHGFSQVDIYFFVLSLIY
jgi:hypothetical protein